MNLVRSAFGVHLSLSIVIVDPAVLGSIAGISSGTRNLCAYPQDNPGYVNVLQNAMFIKVLTVFYKSS